MTDWKSRIRDAWDRAAPPGDQVLSEEALDVLARHPDSLSASDASDTAKWLAGKTWDEIAEDLDRMDVEMPLPYLNVQACCYYLGGYLLHLADAFQEEYISPLAPVHFASFLGSSHFERALPGLSLDQRTTLRNFAAIMLENDDSFLLGEKFSARLASGIRLLAASR